MSGTETYLDSKATLDELLANDKFVYRAKLLVNTDRGTPEYVNYYNALDNLLKELGIKKLVRIIKSDGSVWYCSIFHEHSLYGMANHNNRQEVSSAINYAFGKPVTDTKIYPKNLQSRCLKGYGFAERRSTSFKNIQQYVAYTYKPSPSPLSNNVFTVRVSEVVS